MIIFSILNIKIFFNGFSHPNWATAEYVGEVVFYDEESWASRNLNIFIIIISYRKYPRITSKLIFSFITVQCWILAGSCKGKGIWKMQCEHYLWSKDWIPQKNSGKRGWCVFIFLRNGYEEKVFRCAKWVLTYFKLSKYINLCFFLIGKWIWYRI